jgi:putative ABC transport system permease protein
VRVALGATRTRVVGWVAAAGGRLLVRGALLGLAGALLLGRALGTLLFGIDATDPVTAAGVVAVLVLLGVAATCVPAWRAAALDPATLLRRE